MIFDSTRRDTAESFRRFLYSRLGLSDSVRFGLIVDTPSTKNPDFASISITDYGQTTAEDSDFHCHLELSLSVGYLTDGLAYGFRKVRVRFDLADHSRGHLTSRLGLNGSDLTGEAKVTPRGTNSEPFWEVVTSKKVLDGEYRTNDDPLAKLEVRKAPLDLRVELSAHLFDGSLVAANGTMLPSVNKTRVLERLMSMSLSDDSAQDGWIKLSTQSGKISYV